MLLQDEQSTLWDQSSGSALLPGKCCPAPCAVCLSVRAGVWAGSLFLRHGWVCIGWFGAVFGRRWPLRWEGRAEAARGLSVLPFVTATFKMGGVCPVHNRCENGFNVVIHHSVVYQLVHVLCCICNSGTWRALWNKSFGCSSFVMRVFGYVGFSCCLFYSGYVWYLEFIYYPDKTLILMYILWFLYT